jgi:hypothetical protein
MKVAEGDVLEEVKECHEISPHPSLLKRGTGFPP